MTALGSKTWCPTCRHMQTVEDYHTEGHYETGREVGYTVTDLDCGHTHQTTPTDLGPAPGAPYAGPQTVVAATPSPRHLRDAAARQIVADSIQDGEL